MQLIEIKEGNFVFNWYQLPEPMNLDFKLRDKIFQELQQKFNLNNLATLIDSRLLFEMNQYTINRINSEIKLKKKDVLHNKTSFEIS